MASKTNEIMMLVSLVELGEGDGTPTEKQHEDLLR